MGKIDREPIKDYVREGLLGESLFPALDSFKLIDKNLIRERLRALESLHKVCKLSDKELKSLFIFSLWSYNPDVCRLLTGMLGIDRVEVKQYIDYVSGNLEDHWEVLDALIEKYTPDEEDSVQNFSDYVEDDTVDLETSLFPMPVRKPQKETIKFDRKVNDLISRGLTPEEISLELQEDIGRIYRAKKRLEDSRVIRGAKMSYDELHYYRSIVVDLFRQGKSNREIFMVILNDFCMKCPERPIKLADVSRLLGVSRELTSRYYKQIPEGLPKPPIFPHKSRINNEKSG